MARRHQRAEVRVKGRHHLVGCLDNRHRDPLPGECLRQLKADVAASHHYHPPGSTGFDISQQGRGIIECLYAMDMRQLEPRQRRPNGYCARRYVQLVEAEAVAAAVEVIADLGLALVEVQTGHLVSGTHIDPHGPEFVGRTGDQIFQAVHDPANEIRNTAR